MGIRDYLENKAQEKFNKRLSKALDESIITDPRMISFTKDEAFLLKQNEILYKGDTSDIVRFYKTVKPYNNIYPTNLFYRVVDGKLPIMHYGLPGIISKSMSNLVFSDKPLIECLSGNKTKDKELNKKLNEIFNDNHIKSLLQEAAEMESYSGAVAFKPVLDPDVSDYPILIPYPKEKIVVIKKYGRVQEVIFKDEYEQGDDKNKEKYVLNTICGKGYISYKLNKICNNKYGKETAISEVNINSIPETTGLKDINFYNIDGTEYNKLLCIYKENKTNAASDYAGLYDDFAALDEIMSNRADFIRQANIITYLPDLYCIKDEHGNVINQNVYSRREVVIPSNNMPTDEAAAKLQAQRDIPNIGPTMQAYEDAFRNTLLHALASAGLSPATCGYDFSGANSSALALNIRERVSLRTRSEKQNRWQETLKELSKLVLTLDSNEIKDGVVYVTPYDKDVSVKFAEYESPTFTEHVASLSQALDANLIDLDTALLMLWSDKSEDELEIMKMNIEGQLPSGEDIEEKELDKEDEVIEESTDEEEE